MEPNPLNQTETAGIHLIHRSVEISAFYICLKESQAKALLA